MSQISYEEFKDNFNLVKLTDVTVKRYIRLYIYYTVSLNNIKYEGVFKKQKKLMEFFQQVKKQLPNFPLPNNQHDLNLIKIFNYCQQEYKKQRYDLLPILYEFLFEKKHLENFRKAIIENEIPVKPQQKVQSQVPQNSQTFDPTQLFQEIFNKPGKINETTYIHMLLYETFLNDLSINKTGYKIKININESQWVKRFAHIQNKSLLLYEEEQDFLKDGNSFSEMFILIKIDSIKYEIFDDEHFKVILKNDFDYIKTEIILKKKSIKTFLFNLMIEMVKKESTIINQTMMPEPCENLGTFILFLEKTGNFFGEKKFLLNSGLINIEMNNIGVQKTFIFPIFNVFDIYEVILGEEFYFIETFEILELKNCQKNKIFEFSGYRLSIQKLNQYIDVYVQPPIQNYDESRVMKTGIKKNYNELKISTFRLKRFLSAYYEVSKILSHFNCFKYPFFTTTMYTLSIIVLIFQGVGLLAFLIVLGFFLYFHPSIQLHIKPILDKIFFGPENHNKYYIDPKVKSKRQLDIDYYLDISNLNKKKTDTKKSFKQTISNAFNFSSKLPKHINLFVNMWEKAKNIFLWKNQKKSQIVFILFIVGTYVLYVIGLRFILLFYILFRFAVGRNYFKKVVEWNTDVLYQMIIFFLKREMKFKGYNIEDYFISKQNDQGEKKMFSKKFSLFIDKELQISVPENYWIDKFTSSQIIVEFLHSEKKIKLPFIEKKSKIALRIMVKHFLLSTPSDCYYENLHTLSMNTIQKIEHDRIQEKKQNQKIKNSNQKKIKKDDKVKIVDEQEDKGEKIDEMIEKVEQNLQDKLEEVQEEEYEKPLLVNHLSLVEEQKEREKLFQSLPEILPKNDQLNLVNFNGRSLCFDEKEQKHS